MKKTLLLGERLECCYGAAAAAHSCTDGKSVRQPVGGLFPQCAITILQWLPDERLLAGERAVAYISSKTNVARQIKPSTMRPFATFLWRLTASHIISYFLAGVFAYHLLNYQVLFETSPFSCFMKPTNSIAVTAGPALQFIRGIIFSISLWSFKEIFLHTKYGWLKLWGLLIGLSILSTTAAAPGSIEGFIYTTIPIEKQIIGYLEVVPQTLLFSLMVSYWYKFPRKAWNIIAIVIVSAILLVLLLAITVARE